MRLSTLQTMLVLSWANPAEPGPKFPPGPETVNSSLPDSILPSSVQIAPSLPQSVAAGSTMVTVPSSSAMPDVPAIKRSTRLSRTERPGH